VKQQHLKRYLQNAKSRAKRDKVPFNLTLQDLIEIATDKCPILHTPFVWGASGLGKGKTRLDSPTLDRILPELGYVKGNVAFLSYRANRIKDNGTMQEHYDIADWIWNHTHAKENTTTSVPAGDHQQGEVYPELGPFSTTWPWQDDNNPDNHIGTIPGQDVDHRPQESSGDSVGHGGQEVGTFKILEGLENFRDAYAEAAGLRPRGRRIPDKS
jgi:hypothetical protein